MNKWPHSFLVPLLGRGIFTARVTPAMPCGSTHVHTTLTWRGQDHANGGAFVFHFHADRQDTFHIPHLPRQFVPYRFSLARSTRVVRRHACISEHIHSLITTNEKMTCFGKGAMRGTGPVMKL
ncbi:unnamed protein product [Ectocarpus sp. 13 AM-2016]